MEEITNQELEDQFNLHKNVIDLINFHKLKDATQIIPNLVSVIMTIASQTKMPKVFLAKAVQSTIENYYDDFLTENPEEN